MSNRQPQGPMSDQTQRETGDAQGGTSIAKCLPDDSNLCKTQRKSVRQGLTLSYIDHAARNRAFLEENPFAEDTGYDDRFGQMDCDYDMDLDGLEDQYSVPKESQIDQFSVPKDSQFDQHSVPKDSQFDQAMHISFPTQALEQKEALPYMQSPRECQRFTGDHPIQAMPLQFGFETKDSIFANVSVCEVQEGRGALAAQSMQVARIKYLKKQMLRMLDCCTTSVQDWTKDWHRDDVGKAVLAIMPRFASEGNIHKIEKCLELMISTGHSPFLSRAFNIALAACKKEGNLSKAVEWWNRMAEFDLAPDLITYNTMISVCVRGNKLELAEWWAERMINVGIAPCLVTFTTLIQAYGHSGYLERAEYWLRRMRDHGLLADIVLQNAMMVAYSNNGYLSKAEALFYEMQEEGVALCQKTFNVLIHACAKHGRMERAEHWYREMHSSGFRSDQYTYGSLFAGCAQRFDITRTEYYLERMISENIALNQVCVRSILKLYVECSQENRLAKVLAWCMKSNGVAHHVVHEVLSMRSAQVKSTALLSLYADLCAMRTSSQHRKSCSWS
eukprot:TRINITY_DN5017_c1_g1_i1.p1 TRINITY_DN5017_c1_g1~~TRINITY_DN5017_c1_g1_i1.p1  ORF type:complete len:559 (+),score=74.02 TRINITY_DN5017_c1_g1_i1:75-1751(+)